MNRNLHVATDQLGAPSWSDEQRQIWAARARDYNKLDWVNKKDFMQSLLDFCHPRKDWHALDVGTGPGVVAAALLPHVRRITGIDITPEMIERARQNFSGQDGMIFEECNVENLQFEDETFDLAVGRMVFHHVDDCLKGLKEILRTLKTGSCCVVCEGVPPDHLTRQRYEEIFSLKEKRHTFSEAELINLFDWAGFADITLQPYFLRQVSLNNWLQNGALESHVIEEIRRLHVDADEHFKKMYRLNERDGDVFMDWKFIFIKGWKQAG